MLIFEKAPFPSCHASTIVEVATGHFLVAWFGGTAEGAKDVQIWASQFDGIRWTPPQVFASEPGQPCWNPVLFRTPKKEIVLWYKAGPNPMEWTGHVRRSSDQGKTWSKPAMLPAGCYGPVRAKPIALSSGVILAPTSVESYRCWTPYVDRSTDDGKTWLRSNAFGVPEKPGQIQPTIVELKSGSLLALMRSKDPRAVCRSTSADSGVTWTPAAATELPNNSSGIDMANAGADLFLIHNPVTKGRTPLRVSQSRDDGTSWKTVRDLESGEGEFSYPAMILGRDGKLHITYTWNRTHIKYEVVAI